MREDGQQDADEGRSPMPYDEPAAERGPAGEVGGDPVCWLERVCEQCGRLSDAPLAARCEDCGAALR